MTELNLADMIRSTRCEGPGRRFALRVQGCLRRCPGCCNPEMQAIRPARIVDCDTVIGAVLEAAEHDGVEGVTFLGGEPFLQARGLYPTAKRFRSEGLSVMVFTGYTFEELRESPLPGGDALLEHTDVLVDGPYIASMPERERNWVGSANQRFHYPGSFYSPRIERDPAFGRGIEVRVGRRGIRVNGWPDLFPLLGARDR
jgi:anaerobic ribonucleoside-triphosphate reductase activating protein